jgi:hypothetical protein
MLEDIVVLSGLTALSFVTWLRSLKAARHSENLARTRIRGAAQGYVELFGMTRPLDGGALKAPLSGRSCVWWRFSVSETDGEVVTYRHDESRKPFYIQDATGRCLVNPIGAELTPSDAQEWQSDKSPALQDAVSPLQGELTRTRYYCSESVLLPGVRLYVLGEFRTVRKAPHALDRMRERLAGWLRDHRHRAILDVNRDGRIDDTELAAARRAAMHDARREVGTAVGYEDCISEPGDGRPFAIAPRVKPTYVREHTKAGWLALLTFFGCLAGWAWLLLSWSRG